MAFMGAPIGLFDPETENFEFGFKTGKITLRFIKTYQTKKDHVMGNKDSVRNFYASNEYAILNNKCSTGYVLHTHCDGSQIAVAHVKEASNSVILKPVPVTDALEDAVENATY